MKISTKGRYGLRILIDLATHDPAKPRQLHDIAQSQQISEKYISRLVLDLRKAKLIRSTRGVNGGIHLVKSPEEITLLEILETMEGPISVVNCVHSPAQCRWCVKSQATLRDFSDNLYQKVSDERRWTGG